MIRFVFGLLALLLSVGSASAQSPLQARVTSSCGTPGQTLTAGQYGPLFMDTTGTLCSGGGGGGGGGTSSNFNAAFPTAGTAIGFSNGTNMVPGLVDGSGYLEVNVKAGGGSGLSVVDGVGFTAGTSPFTPGGCEYAVSGTTLTTATQGMFACDVNRALFVHLNSTPSLANGNGTVPTQGGAVLSATNGGYTNVLQGNAVLSATNGLYANLLQGNAVLSATNPIYITPATGAGLATSANQATNSATTAHTCSTGGFSELGCLGQIDDDLKSAPNLVVNGTNTAWTGLTPGTAQTGTIVAANVDHTSTGGVAMGTMANYGTSPGAVKVEGVNAFVTNTITAGLNTTPTIANGNGVVPTQGGAVLSATNGWYGNILQGNAVLSATNGIYANALQGNAVLSATNPSFAALSDGTNGPAAVKAASTPSPATDKSLSVTLNAGSNGLITTGTAGSPSAQVVSVQGVSGGTVVPVSLSAAAGAAGYPTGATPITASATGTTAAVVATLAASATGKTTYICGFIITADATALTTGAATVTGTITGTLNFIQAVAAVTNGTSVLSPPAFTPCIPGSAVNTAIVVTSAAAGTGGNTAVSTWGFQL